ncbi:MAG: lytic transglycosylase domain-containing protein [Clostridia bacterium]|nr:lytic transglycosylase domain-containing protein [Clostridia bacterium]
MNNTPAPHRRRRQSAIPEENPVPVVRRRRAQAAAMQDSAAQDSAAQHAPVRRSAARSSASSFLEQIPLPVRVALIALCLLVFFTCAVSVTRSYLAAQEERRRLEAEAAERAQHPLEYADMITYYAAVQGLDPALVSAIILCESSFNPKAESYLGARGLMQLMPDTAEWVAHKLDEDDASYTFDRLYDPETNIRFGAWYLGYLSRRFDGDATKIVCAYHAGQGNVDAWLKNPQYSRNGVTLDVIPTSDTAAYASRVLRAMEVYRKYYFPAATQQPAA